MVGILIWIGGAWASDCTVEPRLLRAQEALFSLELDEVRQELSDVELAFVCGSTPPEEIARFWLITAGLASFEEDSEGTLEAFRAARSADLSFWIEALGVDLEQVWSGLEPSSGSHSIVFDPPTDGYQVRVDGKTIEGELALPAGLHVIQVRNKEASFGRVFDVVDGQRMIVSTGLAVLQREAPPPAPVVLPTNPVEKSPMNTGLKLQLALGFNTSVGARWASDEVVEPALRLAPGGEAGLRWNSGSVWVRGAVAAQVLIGGRYLVLGDTGVRGWVASPSLLASGGVTIGERVDVGVLAGLQLPSRVPLRVVGALALSKVFGLEARVGVTLTGERSIVGDQTSARVVPHPAFSVLAVASF